MKFAILDNKRIEAKPNLIAECPNCGNPVKSYCGEQIIHHWKHIKLSDCDNWYEPETKWHRDWKNHFNINSQEVIKYDSQTNEKHIADIYNEKKNVVLEFQHSPVKIQEIKSREVFYDRMIWVVDLIRFKKNIIFIKNRVDITNELNNARLKNNDYVIKQPDFNSFQIEQEKHINFMRNSKNWIELTSNKDHFFIKWKYRHKRWFTNSKVTFFDLGDNYIYRLVTAIEIGGFCILKRYSKSKFISHYK